MTSRYESSAPLTYVSAGGASVTYLAPRILPATSPGSATTAVRSEEVHRLDVIANRTLRAPLLAWRIADANLTLDPFDLCATPGQVIVLPPATI